jgi:hypothetical protein
MNIVRLLLLIAFAWLLFPAEVRAQPYIRDFVVATSAEGRPIEAVQIGNGPRKLVLIGDTHGGPEANTYTLVSQLVDYFRANPTEVPASVRLYLIPTINPDGLALNWRFNAAGVDLNRNMNTNLDPCPENDWRPVPFGAGGIPAPTGGRYPDSEVESRVLRWFLLDASAAVFYHSAAGLVFPAACEHSPSIKLAQVYAEAAGYEYARTWPRYLITGGMHDWAGSLGIAAITPELVTGDLPEFSENLAGVQAILTQADELVPTLDEQIVGDLAMPAPLWRYWTMHGGAVRFGKPLTGAQTQADGVVRQFFENAVFELRPTAADTPDFVVPMLLGRKVAAGQKLPLLAPEAAQARYFPETSQALGPTFAAYWERAEGLALFGFPLSGEVLGRSADGQRRTMQIYERAVLSYYPEDDTIRPEPLGWYALAQQRLALAPLANQIR